MCSLSRIRDVTVRSCWNDFDPSIDHLHQWYTPDRIIILPRRYPGYSPFQILTDDQITQIIMSVHCMAEKGIAFAPPFCNGRQRLRVRRVFA
ncbi:hypothetical protein CHUAL_012417 [Chamberlinius hualienensis]